MGFKNAKEEAKEAKVMGFDVDPENLRDLVVFYYFLMEFSKALVKNRKEK